MSEPAPVLSGTTEYSKVQQQEYRLRQDDALLKEYKIDDIALEIVSKQYKTVALQFPDDLIPESTHIATILQEKVENSGTVIYVLADTSYSPCCVDEIAAQHVKADCVVHFGHACLNPVKSIPVIYAFGGYDVDVDLVEIKFKETIENLDDDKVIVMADPQYSKVLDQLKHKLQQNHKNIVFTALKPPKDGSVAVPPIETHGYTQSLIPNRLHPELVNGGEGGDLSGYQIFFITAPPPSSSLILHLTTLVSTVNLLEVSSPTDLTVKSPHGALMKRYRYVTIARTAGTVGILVNTLSLRDVHSMLKTVQDWVTQAGKKYYTFVVGKPNVAKLANFEVVDIWVVLGCPIGGIIVDSSEFYKPIITPYELNLALKAEITWTGQWLIDFEKVLALTNDDGDADSENVADEENQGDDNDDEAPEFDPVTGKYVSTSRPLRRLKYVDVDTTERDSNNNSSASKDLVSRMNSQLTMRNTVSTAADVLHNKFKWQGLGSDFSNDNNEDDGATVEKGRSGIARGYTLAETDKE